MKVKSSLRPIYRPCFYFNISITVVMFLAVLTCILNAFSLLLSFELYPSNFRANIKNRKVPIYDRHRENFKLILNMFFSLLACNTSCTLIIILYLILISGDIHPNPGPNFDVPSSSSCSNDLYNFLNLPNHLSTIHYNVQSIFIRWIRLSQNFLVSTFYLLLKLG